MFDIEDDKKTKERKRKILKVGQVFLITIIILTFSSKSIHNLTLPKVSVASAKSGSLVTEIVGEGKVKAVERVEYYLDFSAMVKEVKVSVGDIVVEEEPILILDKESLELELVKKEIELQKLRLQYDRSITNNMEDNLYTFEQKMKEAEIEFLKKERDLVVNQQLYDEGAVSKRELDDAISEYDIAKLRYENDEKGFKTQLEMSEREKENQKGETELMRLEISSTEIEIEELKRMIGRSIITATNDGIIKELNFKEGMIVNNSSPVYILDSPNKGFEVEVILDSEESEYLEIEDSVQMFLKGGSRGTLEGKIRSIENAEDADKKLAVVELEDTELKGGEIVEFYMRKPVGSYTYLVPRQALRTDEMGKYVYILEEKSGPLGKEYYVVRNGVTEGDSDNSNVGILSGLMGDERIVVRSSKSIHDGSQVMVE